MENEKYYILPDFPRPLSEADVANLQDMVSSRGWEVFMSLRKEELRVSLEEGMSLRATEEIRTQHRALFHGLLSDLTFQNRLKNSLKENSKSIDGREMKNKYKKSLDIFDFL